jgi:hypothetical protein
VLTGFSLFETILCIDLFHIQWLFLAPVDLWNWKINEMKCKPSDLICLSRNLDFSFTDPLFWMAQKNRVGVVVKKLPILMVKSHIGYALLGLHYLSFLWFYGTVEQKSIPCLGDHAMIEGLLTTGVVGPFSTPLNVHVQSAVYLQ